MLNLLKNFYICGENYSNYQAWCEGALETSDSVLELIERDINKNNNFIKKVNNNHSIKKNRKYNNKIINVNKTKKNKRILFGGVDKKLKKSLKGYKLSEVEKHNKENDAWIIIDKKVYNITDWIPNHPGGKVIINGIGKDATQMFNNIGHPDYVKNKILPNYLIGKLI